MYISTSNLSFLQHPSTVWLYLNHITTLYPMSTCRRSMRGKATKKGLTNSIRAWLYSLAGFIQYLYDQRLHSLREKHMGYYRYIPCCLSPVRLPMRTLHSKEWQRVSRDSWLHSLPLDPPIIHSWQKVGQFDRCH